MRRENQSSATEFLLLGLPIRPEQQGVFFALFLGMYLTTVLGNLLILLLIRLDPRLHTPMYFFLSHLALTDISFSSVTVPNMLMSMQTQDQSMPYAGCIAQMYFFIFFTDLDSFLITSMAYDRYVAVCRPLHYTTIMKQELCAFLVAGSWILSGASSLSHTLLLTQLSFFMENQTRISEFFLRGIPGSPEQRQLLFGIFLCMYLVTLTGNVLIILAISSDPHLHTPMYFFLANLSFVDMGLTSSTVTKMLVNVQTQLHTISYVGCLTQMYFFLMFGDLDSFFLAVMAYDRYVAICRPLHYCTVMSLRVCSLLLALCWILTHIVALTHTLLMAQLSFCVVGEIAHFFCDIIPVLKLSCSDTRINELMVFALGGTVLMVPFICIVISYIHIVSAVLRVRTPGGGSKAFSTCSSHLCVVCVFYGTLFSAYLCPPSVASEDKDIAAAAVYTLVTPMLNPFIYSLRNKDMKVALKRLLSHRRITAS
ncbi:olfactory receptor 1N1 [Bos javanicus]|uniref:olfactory receptor 1N1 n=1 Tax=Bos javanicus TaxID=9906 RepID=UPI002AA64E32|nr:olfactory receptor 1N1 [Bos javanicus]